MHVKRKSLHTLASRIGTLLLGAVLVLAGCDAGGSNEEEPPGAEVAVAQNDSLGAYLVDESGASLYLFVDAEGDPAPCTSDACLEAWPPLSTEGDPVAGDGADATLLGTTEGPDGATQVVYNGWPLWYFAGDQDPGDVNGHGIVSFGGTWLLVTPSGDGIEVAGENGPAYRITE
jgi:predicted lipoprotein with Yx(FWY)xxD motif